MIRTVTLAALAAALVTPIAHAQAPATTAPGGTARGTTAPGATMAVSDPLFATAAAIGGMAELSLSELGVQKATDPELKRFSQQMIAEHTRMNAELTAAASRRGMTLPRTVDPRAQFCAQSLAGLSGEEFDRCYAKAQLIIHMDSVATFEAEAQRGRDPEIKAVAAKALPHIKEHLKMIKPIAMGYEKEQPSTTGTNAERKTR